MDIGRTPIISKAASPSWCGSVRDSYILSQISGLKRELRIKSAVCAVEYPQAGSPMIMGFFTPVLVLPNRQYDPEKLHFILKHEMIHLKRRDVYKIGRAHV